MFKRSEKKFAFFIISNIILTVFAFGFLVGEIDKVDAQATAAELSAFHAGVGLPGGVPMPVGGGAGGGGLNTPSYSTPFGSIGTGAAPGSFTGIVANILSSAVWAAAAYAAGYLLGSLLGFDARNSQALATGAAAGTFTGVFLAQSGVGTTAGTLGLIGPVGIGIAVGGIVVSAMYRTTSTKTVTFTCLPWQAPVGGQNCQKCNSDRLPCSEYRCKSLGQACELLNVGTNEERCTWVNPKDVSPPYIVPDASVLTNGYKYSDVKEFPPGPGFKITGKTQECVKAFTPLIFGIITRDTKTKEGEPAQCKIDFNSTTKFEDMKYYMGNSNLYKYNHTEMFSLPGPANLEGENLTINNGGNWTFYIRCQDKNGNSNAAEYAVRFCVDPSLDTTPPAILATSILNGKCVAENQDSAVVEFYTNEPASCNWSLQDKGMGLMENQMNCDNQLYQMNALQLYTCRANLTGIGRAETSYYIRCRDQPNKNPLDRNVNLESFVFKLRGSTGLKIRDALPNETIYSSINPAGVELSAETILGCGNGKAICFYSETDNDADYVQFFETGDVAHKQRQDLTAGSYTYYYKCVDEGGNVAKASALFNINIDVNAPVVARVYKEGSTLKIVTVRNSECVYDFNNCDYAWEEGVNMPAANSTSHVAEWNPSKTYYIKCRDNLRPESADCSIIVQPSKL